MNGCTLIYANVVAIILALFMVQDIIGQQFASPQQQQEEQQPQQTFIDNVSNGVHRVIPKTNFQCGKRPPGYYADVQTGCQVYHMCDGLGRQFSYACPNTTLFQQRMLICDHWYMVNCSKSESNYGANLLIGQRDQPFVRDEDAELRTPRPDLLDRPYAPDYSGESFRAQYKSFAPIQNLIAEINQKQAINYRKTDFNFQGKSQSAPLNRNQPIFQRIVSTTIPPTSSPVISQTQFPTRLTDSNDLKVASSQDSRRSQNDVHFENDKPKLKTPSVEYELPFLYPVYNENYTKEIEQNLNTASTKFISTTTTKLPFVTRKATKVFSTRVTAQPTFIPFTTTTTQRPSSPSGFVERKSSNFFDSRILTQQTQQNLQPQALFRAQPTQPSTTTSPATVPLSSLLSTPKPFTSISSGPSTYPEPPTGLLPPFETIPYYDDSTTQGPSIYSEWKIPSSGLEPPFVDDSHLTAQNGNNNNNQIPVIPPEKARPSVQIPIIEKDLVPPLFENFNNQLSQASTPEFNLQPPSSSNNNDTDTSASNHSFTSVLSVNDALQNFSHATITEKSQTQRSVSSSDEKNLLQTTKDVNYGDLQKKFSIPEYTFPLETVSRPGYQNRDAVNSFQVKIPDSGDGDKRKKWYGENEKCPECHPSFLKPGSCEPCVKFR